MKFNKFTKITLRVRLIALAVTLSNFNTININSIVRCANNSNICSICDLTNDDYGTPELFRAPSNFCQFVLVSFVQYMLRAEK